MLRDGTLRVVSPRGLGRTETLLIEALPVRDPGRALFGMDSEGAVALAARKLWPDADVEWFHLDAYVAAKVARNFATNRALDLTADARPDPPEGPFDLIALPFGAGREALLMRDTLEAAHDALRVGGRLIAATDGKVTALRDVLKKVFGNWTPAAPPPKSSRRDDRGGAFYAERKRERPRRADRAHVREARFEHPGGETTIQIETRPGTFAHGQIDRGTRTLAEWLEVSDEETVADLGAGCGTLGLLAAARLPNARVLLVDSNARAIDCARRSAERAGMGERVTAVVAADFENLPDAGGGGYALCLANPPYFGDFRIARSFVGTAHRILRPGGRLALVTRSGKASDAHAEVVREVFADVDVHERGDYTVLEARRGSILAE